MTDDVAAGLGQIEPPDSWVAVGPSHVVQSVNSLVRITDRSGRFVEQTTAVGFFGVLPSQQSHADPHVVYDAAHQRWLGTYLSFDCSNGYLYLAVSTSADPTSTWTKWYFTFPGVVPDYPEVGFSADKVVIAQNEFPIGSSGAGCDVLVPTYGSSVLVMDWAAILAGGTLPNAYFPADTDFWSWRAGRNLSADPAIHLVAEDGWGGDVISATITGTVAQANVWRSWVDLSMALSMTPFGSPMPPAPRQPGVPATIANAVDDRPTDAVWQNGSLWFVSTFGCVPSGDSVLRDCVRVTQLSTAGPSLVQDFAIGFAGYDTFMGGIGLSTTGDAYIVYSTSSPTNYASTWTNAQLLGDPANSLRSRVLLASGAATYLGDRWGDYVGVATDPVVSTAVWAADEYANAAGSWSTQVSMLRQQTVPTEPMGVSATAGDASAQVTWSAPTDNGGSPITAYTVTSSPDGGACGTAGTLSCAVVGLTNGTPYTFTVTATNAAGTGPASAASAAVTPSMPPTASVTGLPTWLAATSVPLSWSAVAGTFPVANYDVRYRRAAWNGAFGSSVTWQSVTTATSATFPGSAGSTYCFSVVARDTLDAPSAPTAETCTAVPLDDRSMTRYGSWTKGTGSAYYRSTYVRSYSYGAKLTRTGVVARRIALVATTCRTCGKVRVYWGSTLLRTISLYSATTVNRKLITVTTFASARTGTLSIRVYSSGKKVIIDGVAIRRN